MASNDESERKAHLESWHLMRAPDTAMGVLQTVKREAPAMPCALVWRVRAKRGRAGVLITPTPCCWCCAGDVHQVVPVQAPSCRTGACTRALHAHASVPGIAFVSAFVHAQLAHGSRAGSASCATNAAPAHAVGIVCARRIKHAVCCCGACRCSSGWASCSAC